ncbi:rCG34837 [Rattus norvegicus]|uniref:RCG34837 n=1 Tax=Rattus norvegicus TaxID=10116 RepID=A6HKF1_RAT|nr:rCG34837 [Rattus norvegicus]
MIMMDFLDEVNSGGKSQSKCGPAPLHGLESWTG